MKYANSSNLVDEQSQNRIDLMGLGSRVDAAVQSALNDRRVVGAVVKVLVDGDLVYSKAHGLADREAGKPMTEDGVFGLSSLTKPIVTSAAMALIEQGKLSLDDPVSKWIPEFQPKLADGTTPVITVHHLLTHTSGLSYRFLEPADGPYAKANVSDGMDQPGLSISENLRRIASVPLSFAPGSAWLYSVGMDVIGEVISRVTGQSLPEAVRSIATGPLGMDDTSFLLTETERYVTPYGDGSPEPVRMGEEFTGKLPFGAGVRFQPARLRNSDSFASGGGGMVGTAGDFVKLLEMLRTGVGAPFSQTTLTQMRTNQIGDMPVFAPESGQGFGYGFAILKDPSAIESPQSPGTIMWGGVYGHNWFVDVPQGLSVVLMTNTGVEGMNGQLAIDVRNAVYG